MHIYQSQTNCPSNTSRPTCDQNIFHTLSTTQPITASYLGGSLYYFVAYTQKRGASSVLGPTCWGSRIALVVVPSNAESPTPMYIVWPSLIGRHNFYTSRGVPVALVLTTSLNLRDSNTSNPKRSENAFSMYVARPPVITQRAFSIQKGHCKDTTFFVITTSFIQK